MIERRTHDRNVSGSSPGRSGDRIFFSRGNFLCRLLFRYPFHPRVTAVARKRSRSFCQKCRWQVTAVSSGTSHATTKQRCKYTTWKDINKTGGSIYIYKTAAVTHFTITCNKSAMSLLESGEQRYIKVIKNNNNHHHTKHCPPLRGIVTPNLVSMAFGSTAVTSLHAVRTLIWS